jgi:hypothetical protein
MDTAAATEPLDALIRSGARRLTGFRRRAFIAEVASELIGDNYFPLLTTIRIRFSGDGVQDPSA